MEKITRERFKEATGHWPVLDELERCNCDKVGFLGHWHCGWCDLCDKPRFMCSHLVMGRKNAKETQKE
jgi:hypothetical protein